MQVWGVTDIGLVRKENQDAYLVRESGGHTICVVCDGMGGAAGGRLASQIATETFVDELERLLAPGIGRALPASRRTTLWWSAWWTGAILPPRRPAAIPAAI